MAPEDRQMSPEEVGRAEHFQNWLTHQLELRHWSQADFAEELGVYRTSINRWFADPRSSRYRLPSHRSGKAIAEVLNLPLDLVVREVGTEKRPTASTAISPLRHEVLNIVRLLPEEVIIVLAPALRGIVDRRVRDQILLDLRELSKDQVASGMGAIDHKNISSNDNTIESTDAQEDTHPTRTPVDSGTSARR